jgi:hypothetical protein
VDLPTTALATMNTQHEGYMKRRSEIVSSLAIAMMLTASPVMAGPGDGDDAGSDPLPPLGYKTLQRCVTTWLGEPAHDPEHPPQPPLLADCEVELTYEDGAGVRTTYVYVMTGFTRDRCLQHCQTIERDIFILF